MPITPKNKKNTTSEDPKMSGDIKAQLVAIKEEKKDPKKSLANKVKKKTSSKDQGGLKVPKKGDCFIVKAKGIEGRVVKATTSWEITVRFGNKEEIILAWNLWDQVDQQKGYYKPTKTKYDWEAIKQDFFESDFIDVAPFLQATYQINTSQSSQAREKTKWWADEKKKIQEEMKQKALEDFKLNIKKRWEHVFDILDQAHVKGLTDLANMILDQWQQRKRKIVRNYRDPETKEITSSEIFEIDDITPFLHQADMINILKHIKLEKGEPTDIVDNNGKSQARAWLDDLKKQKTSSKQTQKDGE